MREQFSPAWPARRVGQRIFRESSVQQPDRYDWPGRVPVFFGDYVVAGACPQQCGGDPVELDGRSGHRGHPPAAQRGRDIGEGQRVPSSGPGVAPLMSEQGEWYRLRGQPRHQRQDVQRSGAVAGQLVERHRPRGGQRDGIAAALLVTGHQFMDALVEQFEVLLGRQAGYDQQARCLVDGQRQVTQCVGDAVGVSVGEPVTASAEQLNGLGTAEFRHRECGTDIVPIGIAGSDDHVPVACGQQRAQGGRVLGVVEHHQPPPPRLQHPTQPRHRDIRQVLGSGQVQGLG